MAALGKKQDLMCSICLNFFDNPHILPCDHTFCDKCLRTSSSICYDSDYMTCPRCNAKMCLPKEVLLELTAEPVSDEVKEVTEAVSCKKHPGQIPSFLCRDCTVFICRQCKQETHGRHAVHEMLDNPSSSKVELVHSVRRVALCERSIRSALDKVRQTEKLVREKERALDRLIRERKESLLHWVQAASVKSLVTLENSSKKLIATLHADEFALTEKLKTINEIKESMASAAKGPVSADALVRKGSKERLLKLVSGLPVRTDFPVLHYEDDSVMRDTLLAFIGHAVPRQQIALIPEMTIKLAFRCFRDSQTDVHALCPAEEGRVWVAFGHYFSDTGEIVSLYAEDGEEQLNRFLTSRVCLATVPGGWVVAEGTKNKAWYMTPKQMLDWTNTGPEEQYRLYSKLKARFYLCVYEQGSCDLRSVIVRIRESGVPIISGTKVCDVTFTTKPLALDVSEDGGIIAALEEDNHNVLLFSSRSEEPSPYVTFSPDGDAFRPRDLCFCSLGGLERLVVADWLNDVLLVLHVTRESCTLVGHLGGSCPLLLKPTCVTADDADRLWVGCRGGNVLVMQQKD